MEHTISLLIFQIPNGKVCAMCRRLCSIVLSTAVFVSLAMAGIHDGYAENSHDVLVSKTDAHTRGHILLTFYQQKISVHGEARCRFYPSCSAFYREALDRYGPIMAGLMLLDRILYREHAWSLREYPFREDVRLYEDPVHRNYILNSEGYYR